MNPLQVFVGTALLFVQGLRWVPIVRITIFLGGYMSYSLNPLQGGYIGEHDRG